MSWLAPWALAAGALGMLGVVAAHLLTRQRPHALALATARFLPAGMLEATTLQRVPADRWWMLLRLLILALLALGVAQPVATLSRVPTRTVLLLDRTAPLAVQQRSLAALNDDDVVIAFDSNATLTARGAVQPRVARHASLSAAFARLARVRDSLARGTEQLRIALASPLSAQSFDPATQSFRELLPDSISTQPLDLPVDSVPARGPIVVHAQGNDPIAATAVLLGDSVALAGTIIERGTALTGDDSAAARTGATVLWWPSRVAADSVARQALTVASATWIAPMDRESSTAQHTGRTVGWWADGSDAMHETALGVGCVIRLDAGLPVAGDQTLSLSAQAWLAAVLTSCEHKAVAADLAPVWLASPTARRAVVGFRSEGRSALAPWLIGAALLLAALELLIRAKVQR